ncbi:BTB/POZ domain-containing protein At5g03250 [Lactuca sativa]|uniref:BTB/POZ domain-containing protein At5g03250 n=1 Tax=Lactuca sativa TaxID=4236 RepID=UPI000CAB1B38|nr:BTB/POZ domain-containing protein At5g03250 [Lactuca sativa]
MVANLIDNYLAEVASDVNLKLKKFQSLVATVTDFARSIDEGMYRAIDIYLKKFELKWRNLVIVILQAHPWLIDFDWELLCRLMAYQKLSLEANTHAAQNKRLPLRFIVRGSLLREASAADICCRLLLCLLKLQLTDIPEQHVLPESGNVHLFPFVWIASPREEHERKK